MNYQRVIYRFTSVCSGIHKNSLHIHVLLISWINKCDFPYNCYHDIVRVHEHIYLMDSGAMRDNQAKYYMYEELPPVEVTPPENL